MEYRIYAKGKLINCCFNEYVLMCNLTIYREKYGKENIEIKYKQEIMDEEKKEWIKTI